MTIHDYIANFIQSTYNYEKTQGFWARLFYMTPAQRVQRLNEIFDTKEFWENTQPNKQIYSHVSEQQSDQRCCENK